MGKTVEKMKIVYLIVGIGENGEMFIGNAWTNHEDAETSVERLKKAAEELKYEYTFEIRTIAVLGNILDI